MSPAVKPSSKAATGSSASSAPGTPRPRAQPSREAAAGAATYRQEQAAATRLRIAHAARDLFATQGYGSTSMAAIAQAAGVAERTIYSACGAKREIISMICEHWLEQAQARERAAEVLAEPDPRRRLRASAGWLVHLYSTDFGVVTILDSASDEDEETRVMLRAKLAGRNHVMDAMIASVVDQLQVPLGQAQAVFRAYAAPGVYRELVEDSGWAVEEFENWLADALEHQLMPRRTRRT